MDRKVNKLKPLLFYCNALDQKEALKDLIKRKDPYIVDTFEQQVKELFVIRNPFDKNDSVAKQQYYDLYCADASVDELGVWVYYPWLNKLVHILNEEEFFLLRTARNIPLIKPSDQKKYYDLSVGIVGLSVGHSIAVALAYSGGCKHMKLADPDYLELSNLNRLESTILNLGERKTDILAKKIYSLNPFATLELFHEGVSSKNLRDFFKGDHPLDVVVDECDDITLKFNLRLAARAQRTPYLMVTDKGYASGVSIARFDKDVNAGGMKDVPRVSLNDVQDSLTISETLELSVEQELLLIADLLGKRNISYEMEIGCIDRIQGKIASWPQLSMTVNVGGSLAAFILLQIACNGATYTKERVFSFHSLLSKGYHSKRKVNARERHTEKFLSVLKKI